MSPDTEHYFFMPIRKAKENENCFLFGGGHNAMTGRWLQECSSAVIVAIPIDLAALHFRITKYSVRIYSTKSPIQIYLS